VKNVELEVKTRPGSGWTTVLFSGRPMVNSYKKLKCFFETLRREPPFFLFDLKEVSFLDSTILEAFAHFAKHTRDRKGSIAVIHVNSIIRELIEIFCLNDYFLIFQDRKEAEEHLSRCAAGK